MSREELVGVEIGDFQPLRVLGAGGMGVVYEADDLSLRRRVALKVLAPHLVEDRLARERFQREIDHAVAIEHPHVVPVYRAGYERPHFYIAMRLIPGPDLWSVLREQGPLPERRALRLLGQLASALAAVHERGLVHRDVKPQNVLIWSSEEPDDEHAMLTDFGIAKALDDSRGLTGMGALGTPGYMAPEVCLGRGATPASDQYSFACMAFEMLAGRSPYDADRVSFPDAHIEQTPHTLAELAPHISSGVAEAVARGLAKEPAQRHPTIRDFVRSARPAAEAFDRSQAITRVLTETARPVDAVTRLLAGPVSLTDTTISRVTEVDPTEVARARRRTARSALVGRGGGPEPTLRTPASSGSRNSSLTRVQPVFGAALANDPTGEHWLPALLAAAPLPGTLSESVRNAPGSLSVGVRVRTDRVQGRIATPECFEYRVPPSERFLRWCIEHPDELTWPRGQRFSVAAQRWRRAIVFDDPPGRRAAQAEAHAELDRLGPDGGHGKWWVFEGRTAADCLLLTDRLALFIEGKRTDRLSPATSWYPWRNQLVRSLEAAQSVADGRAAALLLITERPEPGAMPEALAASLGRAVPHLSATERDALAGSYLGQMTWERTCAALGVDFAALPDTTNDLGPA